MLCEQLSQPGQDRELRCEPECPSAFNLIEVEQSTKPSCHNAVYNDNTQHASCCEIGQIISQTSPKDTPVIDLTMGEDIVVVPRSAAHSQSQIASAVMIGPDSTESFATLLRSWYTERTCLEPPPCAVDVRVKNKINTWKTGQQVFWTYMGIEEMTVRSYELEGFRHQRDRFIIVAQGHTSGPFIIKCLQSNKRYNPPVSYHIWKGLDNTSHDQANCFEQKPSIVKHVRSQNDESHSRYTAMRDSLQTITYHLPPYVPSAEPPYLLGELTTSLCPMEQRYVPSAGHTPMLCNSPALTSDKDEHRKQDSPTKELTFCQRVLDELMDQKHFRLNQPFLQPVDPVMLNAPMYFEVIKQPMDLSTIQRKLATGVYKDSEEFVKDVCLMFNNCKKFNWETDPVYKRGQLLNELFAELWENRDSLAQDNCRNQDVNFPAPCKSIDMNGVRGTRPTIEPFTPPIMSTTSPTEEDTTEVFRPLAPLGEEESRVQISEQVAETKCASHPCRPPETRTGQNSRRASISGDGQHLANFSGQASGNQPIKSPDGLNEPSNTDHCSQMRTTSPVLSDTNWETLRSSREASYTSEMLVEAEREFFLSQPMDCSAVAHSDNRIYDSSSSSCKRKWESTKGNVDEAEENAFTKKPVTLLASQMPCQAGFQDVLQETRPQILGDNQPAIALKDQSASSKEPYKYYSEDCGKDSRLDVSPKGKTTQPNQSSGHPPAANDTLQQESGMSLNQQTPFQSALSGLSECTNSSYMEPSKDATYPENHLSFSPSATLITRASLRLRCSYRGGCRKTFKCKRSLIRHVNTVHLRRRNKLCPICGRRFGRGDELTRHLNGNRCRFTDCLQVGKDETEDLAPTATEVPPAKVVEVRELSPTSPDQRQSVVVENAQDVQEQFHDSSVQLESCARDVATENNAHTDAQKGEFDQTPVDSKPSKREIIEDDDVVEIPAFPPSRTTTSTRLREHLGNNVVFHFYTPAGERTRTRYLTQCDDVHELFGDALTAKAFGPSDQLKRVKGNVLSICFGVRELGGEDDLRVKEKDVTDFKALVQAIRERKWWIGRTTLVSGRGIVEVRAVA